MALLFYWRGDNYPKDMACFKSCELNQNSELMNKVKKGEHIWAFTRRQDKIYVLALDLCVLLTRCNSSKDPSRRYGIYKVEGDPRQSRYFDTKLGANIEQTIRSLGITANAKILGHSFQGRNGVRLLDSIDEQKLIQFSSTLPRI